MNEQTGSLFTDSTVPNQEMFCHNRSSAGGGAALYVRSRFAASKLEQLSLNLDDVENVFVKFYVRGKYYIVGNIYRPPRRNLCNFLGRLVTLLGSISFSYPNSRIYLMGDFNINLMKIEDNAKCFEYFSIRTSFGYSPSILKSTGAMGCSATIIDQFRVNFLVKPSFSGIILPELTGHHPKFISTAYKYATNYNTSVYTSAKCMFTIEDREAVFRTCILQLPFSSYADSESVEVLCSNFTQDLTNAYNNAYPNIVKNKKKLDIRKPYFTSEM